MRGRSSGGGEPREGGREEAEEGGAGGGGKVIGEPRGRRAADGGGGGHDAGSAAAAVVTGDRWPVAGGRRRWDRVEMGQGEGSYEWGGRRWVERRRTHSLLCPFGLSTFKIFPSQEIIFIKYLFYYLIILFSQNINILFIYCYF